MVHLRSRRKMNKEDWDKIPDSWSETRMLTVEEIIKEFGYYLGEDGIKKLKEMYKKTQEDNDAI